MNAQFSIRVPRWRGKTLRAVLFDLDGTLLDTVDGIAEGLNQALAEQQLGSVAGSQVREMIGHGAPILIARALALLQAPAGATDQNVLLERFYAHYGQILAREECTPRIYSGVTAGLSELYSLGLRLAVVTNKHQRFAADLLGRLGLSQWIQVVIGGDSCERRKPDPQPLLSACAALQVEASQALMVGDSTTDVLAARAAGLPVICVPYGYNEGRDPHTLACDAFVRTLADLPALLLHDSLPHFSLSPRA
jgi:phosphoglycolate phosphatase